MKKYSELVLSLIKATRRGRVDWNQTMEKRGYTAQVNFIEVELFPPVESEHANALISAITDYSDTSKTKRSKREFEWRLVVNDKSINKNLVIYESDLDHEYLHESLQEDSRPTLYYLYTQVKLWEEEKNNSKLNELIAYINNL
ncbi:hypothetical protein [Deinococcus piscis]|uniref:hypothetical protein n=1 Tax=Deinococcus piscis TaxID=394230 RepID=UPI0016744D9F|nr:hypothetical protein [Deinococcus piscis]